MGITGLNDLMRVGLGGLVVRGGVIVRRVIAVNRRVGRQR